MIRIPLKRFLAGSVALAALAALCALAVPRGLADLAAFDPRQALWRSGHAFPAPASPEWTRGRDLLKAALARDPANAGLAENLAAWYERAALRMPPKNPVARAYLQQSLEYLQRAAVLRPGSPYTWSNIALVKLRLGATDAEFARAVENAAQLGPWEPEVQLGLAEVLFAAAEQLPAAVRSAAGSVVVNGLTRHDAYLFERATANGRLAVLCALPGVARSKLALRCI